MRKYDILIIGHPCKDIIVEHTGQVFSRVGGAVYFSTFSAFACGASTGAVMKYAPEDKTEMDILPLASEDVYFRASEHTVSIRSTFFTADKERRRSDAVAIADAFTMDDIPAPDVATAGVYQIAGLLKGDTGYDVITGLAERGPVAVDAQGLLRCVDESGEMVFRDWLEKKEFLPYISYFKTDAAEAEILTGSSDTRIAAETIRSWGAKEVMVSHNKEILVCGDEGISKWPVVSRNLSGRPGRGDTVFAAYLTQRECMHCSMSDALRLATAAVSLKMEKPEPLKATRAEIEEYMREFL